MTRGISNTPEKTRLKRRQNMLGIKRALGYRHTQEAKEKIRQASTEHKHLLGYKRSEEFKKKVSQSMKGVNTWSKGRKLSQETKDKISKNSNPRYGKDSPRWKGGITPIRVKIWKSKEYKLWRKSVFERDNYSCVWCGIKSGNGKEVILNADHIKPFSLYPELRFAIDNGRTLCIDCHRKTDTYAGRIYKYKLNNND